MKTWLVLGQQEGSGDKLQPTSEITKELMNNQVTCRQAHLCHCAMKALL